MIFWVSKDSIPDALNKNIIQNMMNRGRFFKFQQDEGLVYNEDGQLSKSVSLNKD